MKKIIKQISMTFLLIVSLIVSGCKKDSVGNLDVLKSLYKTYKDGEIDECKYNGQTIYSAGLNAYDAGSSVYNKMGVKIADCNYGWGPVDPVCGQLQSCAVIYRCKNHISGEPFVDKYGLSK